MLAKLPESSAQSGLRTIDAGVPCRYYYHAPADVRPDSPVIVSVHGISLNAAEHMVRMRAVADTLGAVVIAPWFDRAQFRGYQRLLCHDGQTRADLALLAMLDDAADSLGVDVSRFHLTGFSGGGQFAHRFAAFHADRVTACVTSAAGWYTFPPIRKAMRLAAARPVWRSTRRRGRCRCTCWSAAGMTGPSQAST